jgi:hypothetical protein
VTVEQKNVVIIKEEETKPVVKGIADDPVYRIQLVATIKTLDIATYFLNISNLVEEYGIFVQKVDILNKYQLGNFSTKGETESLRKVLEKEGYKGCFIVKAEN